jgi:hypothetical protein
MAQGLEGLHRLSVYPIASLRIVRARFAKASGDYTQIGMHL